MRHWIVGDLQGCHDDFSCLLDLIAFDPAADKLWVAGDLVNRGPDSLRTLRAVYALRDSVDCVLGNHDLHLLAEAAGVAPKPQPDLHPILRAPDADELLDWIATRPLAVRLPQFETLIVHAGLHVSWAVDDALAYSDEIQRQLAGQHAATQQREHLASQWSRRRVGCERPPRHF